MSKPEWGIKRVCPSCSIKYYDFKKNPIAFSKIFVHSQIFAFGLCVVDILVVSLPVCFGLIHKGGLGSAFPGA